MLIRQENLPNPYQELLRKAGNSSRAISQGWGRTTGDLKAEEAPSSLESCLFATLGYGKTANRP